MTDTDIKQTGSAQEDPLYAISYENARLEEENKNLKRTVQFYQAELEKFRTPPFIVSEIISITDENRAIVKLPNQSNFLVEISDTIKEELKVGDTVVNEQKSLVVTDKISMSKNFPVENQSNKFYEKKIDTDSSKIYDNFFEAMLEVNEKMKNGVKLEEVKLKLPKLKKTD